LAILKWAIIIVSSIGLIGCTTTNIDWEEAHNIDTPKAYKDFLNKHPQCEYSEQARTRLETLYYERSLEEGTTKSYSEYLVKFPQSEHAKDIRARLKEIRCQDKGLISMFPPWLRQGDSSDPKRHASWLLSDSYIGISPSDIGRNYKASGDDPEYPLELEWGAGHLIYFSGRGVIIGPDGKYVLVGYDCN